MYRKLDQSSDSVLGYFISGTLTREEIDAVQHEIKPAVRKHGKIRILLQIGELSAPEPEAVWEDLKLTPEYVADVERYALVGDKSWQERVASLSDLLVNGEVRYFDSSEIDKAWSWINS
jgi:hypothetical protein